VGQMTRRSAAEKREIIHLVDHSALPVGRTLDELDVLRSSSSRRGPPHSGREPRPAGARQPGRCTGGTSNASRKGRKGWSHSRRSADSSGTGGPSRCATRSSSWCEPTRRSRPGNWPGCSPPSVRKARPAG